MHKILNCAIPSQGFDLIFFFTKLINSIDSWIVNFESKLAKNNNRKMLISTFLSVIFELKLDGHHCGKNKQFATIFLLIRIMFSLFIIIYYKILTHVYMLHQLKSVHTRNKNSLILFIHTEIGIMANGYKKKSKKLMLY